MDWQAIGTLVALLGVIASFVLTLRGQKQDRAIAENSARRSEAAARLTEEYTARVVVALESLAVGGNTPAAPAVRWSLVHSSGDTFRLENVGDSDAYDVVISAHESLAGPVGLKGDLQRIGPGEAVTFMAALVLATTDSTITVSWSSGPTGTDRAEWRYPLPT